MRNKPKYEKCEYCSGLVKEVMRDETLWYHGKLVLIEDVPVGLCQKCGEKYYKGSVLESLELIAKNRKNIKRTVSVPVTSYPA